MHRFIEQIRQISQRHWLIAFLLMICFVPWFVTRVSFLYQYQTPPNQTIHPNYFTFHEMSQSWDEGKKLGVINVSRMVMNSHRLMISDYTRAESPDDKYCTYLSLDPGFAIIVSAARKMFPSLPDSYLRTNTLQVVCDGIMLFAIFVTFLRIGILPATAAGLIYGLHPVFSYQAIFPFQYFWEGWLFAISVISLIWARRFSLANRPIAALVLIVLVAIMSAFALWVRSSALIAALVFILTMMLVPSLRKYFGIFILVFSLTLMPQVVRASSVQGQFALSTRMSWHTAFHALGRYPNKYGIEDEDQYAFDTAQNDYGVSYNYCDYSKHDRAIKQAFMKVWEKDPGFVIHSMISRITTNLIYNFNFDMDSYTNVALLIAALFGLYFALVRRGEYLFISGMMAMVYVGYNVATGIFYYAAPPYAYVAQLALLFSVPILIPGIVGGAAKLLKIEDHNYSSGKAPLAKATLIVLLILTILSGGLLSVPQIRNYVFQKKPYQYLWFSYSEPNREDNERMVSEWQSLPAAEKRQFLEIVHKTIPATDKPEDDVARYFANNYLTIVYYDRGSGKVEHHAIFTIGFQKVDLMSAMNAVALTIPGWNMSQLDVIKISDPDSWQGNKIHIVLRDDPDLADSDYQAMASEKFKRYNYDVTWLGPHEMIARHNGKGCDALRAALAVYYRGFCPYDPTTGSSPLTPEMDPADAVSIIPPTPTVK